MKKVLVGLLVIAAMLMMISCESASSPLAPENGDMGDNSLGKGAKPTTSGETAYACNAEGTFAGYNETNDPDYSIYEYTLWAGQHNDAGTVTITNDDENIYVTYNTNETADLGEVHVYVWTDASLIPEKRPAPGQADYVVEDINADEVTVTIPAEIACGGTFYISTHAALVGNDTEDDEAGSGDNAGETAYAGGDTSPDCFDATKGAWWGFVNYTVECFYDISGTVYEDFNNSDDLEAGENVFGGITVDLRDASGSVIASTTTNDDGSYLFEHVAGGADYTVVSGTPEGDYLANENAGGYSISNLDGDKSNIDFGFVPLYDLSVSVAFDGDMDCFSYSTVTINGVEVSSLENQLPGFGYEIVITAYDLDGNMLASETVIGELNEDTELSLTLGGWTCPVDPVVDCNECVDGDLIVNGSFEDEFTGWVNNFGRIGGYPIDRGTFWSTDGFWGIDLIGTGPSDAGYVEQTLCTEIGKEYVLSFDTVLNGGSPSLVVTIDGASQIVSSSGSKAITFTASSASTTIRFAANAYYNYLYNNVLLDNVSVACGDDDSSTGDGDFPLWGQDISHVILVFTGDSWPNGVDGNDGYYTIKVDEYQDQDEDDLDNDIDAYLAALVAQGYLVDGAYDLLGSSIKGGQQITSFYAYGDYNTNGTAADTPPAGLGFSYNGTSDNEGNQYLIDEVIDRAVLTQ